MSLWLSMQIYCGGIELVYCGLEKRQQSPIQPPHGPKLRWVIEVFERSVHMDVPLGQAGCSHVVR